MHINSREVLAVCEPITKMFHQSSQPRSFDNNDDEIKTNLEMAARRNVCIWTILWAHKHSATSDKHWVKAL